MTEDDDDSGRLHRRGRGRGASSTYDTSHDAGSARTPGKATLSERLPFAAPEAAARNAVRAAIGAVQRVGEMGPALMTSIAAGDYLESGRLSFEIRSALRRAETGIADLERKDPHQAARLAEKIADARAQLAAQARELALLLRGAPVLEAPNAGSAESEAAWRARHGHSTDEAGPREASLVASQGLVSAASEADNDRAARRDRGDADRLSSEWSTDVAALAPHVGLGAVKVHADAQARAVTDTRGANGVALDRAIYLHPERARPGTPEGRKILAHELIHLAQAQLPAARDAGRGAAEMEAAQLAPALAGGGRVTPGRWIDLGRPAADHDADAASAPVRDGSEIAAELGAQLDTATAWVDTTRALVDVDTGKRPDLARKNAIVMREALAQTTAAVKAADQLLIELVAALGSHGSLDFTEEMVAVEELKQAAKDVTTDANKLIKGSIAPDAVSGIHLWLQYKDKLPHADAAYESKDAGPGKVGPYGLHATTKSHRLLFYIAYHNERRQNEWVIGADDADEFAANGEQYADVARTALPGSEKVDHSQEDGAKSTHLPSMLQLEANQEAPYQQGGSGRVATRDSGLAADAKGPAASGDDNSGIVDMVQKGRDDTNGGPNLVGARNSHLRLEIYTKEARKLAKQLQQDVAAGKIDHLAARQAAVERRNELMRETRAKMSPSAHARSSVLKSDEGRSVDYMTTKKTTDLINGGAKDAQLEKALAADSEGWAKYLEAAKAGENPDYAQAVEELGTQPIVSRAILESTGKSRKWVTALAKFGRVAGATFGALGVLDMVTTIAGAEEGQRWHVAGKELSGFAGGTIGSEAGAVAGVWIASLVVTSTAVIIVVSLITALIGAVIGAETARIMPALIGGAADLVGKALMPLSANITGGGFTGMVERNLRKLTKGGVVNELADYLFEVDGEISKVEGQIAKAEDRAAMEKLQLKRLDMVTQRSVYDQLYAAVRSGAISPQELVEYIQEHVQ